jgi:hypothetical protein
MYRKPGFFARNIVVFVFLGVIGLILIGDLAITLPYAVTVERAIERFEEISGSQNIEVVRVSNLHPWFGNPWEGQFELVINDEKFSGLCVARTFSPLICKIEKQQ